MHARARAAKWLRRVGLVFGVLYPVALVLSAGAMRLIGEAWPITGVALYLPRLAFAAPLPFVVGALLVFRLRRLLWLQGVSVLVIVFPLMGLVLPWPHAAVDGKPSMRILSYNVNSCATGAETIAEEIDRYSPDVVLLQEIGDSQRLEQLMRSRYPAVDVSTQFVFASRYPISSSFHPDKIAYEERERSARFVQYAVETPLGPIAFYDVHPISPRDAFTTLRGKGLSHEIPSGRLFSASNARTIEENFGLRAVQVQALADAAARETNPVVIAGDTNLPGLSRVFRRYLSGYADAFTRAGWGFGYSFPNGKHHPWMRLDRILTSESLRAVGFDIGQSAASDHRCIVADLQRR